MAPRLPRPGSGSPPEALYRLVDDGEIPAYKLGRLIRLKAVDLDVFLESTRVQPGELRHLYPPLKTGDDAGIDGLPEDLQPKRRLPGESD